MKRKQGAMGIVRGRKVRYAYAMRLPVIAIVGRPNVGKSTLFNRLARRRISIVEDFPGVTRDRIYASGEFDDVLYTLIDTGGFEPDPDTQLFEEIREQSQLAIEEADLIIMVVDARTGPTPPDIEVARILRRSNRPLVVAANKVDSEKQANFAHEFYEMGVPAVFPVSAEHARGVGDLIEALMEQCPEDLRAFGAAAYEEREREREGLNDEAMENALEEAAALYDEERGLTSADDDDDDDDDELADDAARAEDESADNDERADGEVPEDDGSVEVGGIIYERGSPAPSIPRVSRPEVLRLCVIGKPNSGKSSLINTLLGEDRHLVSNIAGTTMDAVDSFLEYGGRSFRLIDTAGIRRKRSISQRMEKFAVVSALRGLDRADIALFVIDGTKGVTEQDVKVAAFAHEKGRAIIILVNKWDLKKESELSADEMREEIQRKMTFLDYAPVRFISAKTGRRVFDVLDLAKQIETGYFSRMPTAEVNRVIRAAVAHHQPQVHRGKRVKMYFGAQVKSAPPTFIIAVNDPSGVHFSYRRFLTNRLRDAFGFEGAPIHLIFRQRGNEKGRKENMDARGRRKKRDRLNKVRGKRGTGKHGGGRR